MKKNKPLTFGKVVKTVPEGMVGFVYAVHLNDGRVYYGIKKLYKKIRRKPLKGKKRVRIDYVESDWKTYQTSNTYIQEQIQQDKVFSYEVLTWCESVTEMKATEAYIQLKEYLYGDWEDMINEMINLRLRIRK